MPDRSDEVADLMMALRRAGRSLGDALFTRPGGGLVYVVSGRNGEDPIRGRERNAARGVVAEQVRMLGMLGWPVGY